MTRENAVIMCIVLASVLFLEGIGREAAYLLKKKKEGFQAPLGCALLFCLAEIVFVPNMIFHVSLLYAKIAFVVLLIASSVLCVFGYLKRSWQYKTTHLYLVLVSGILFFVFACLKQSPALSAKDMFTNDLQGFDILKNIVADVLNETRMRLFFKSLWNVLFAMVMLSGMQLLHEEEKYKTIFLVSYGIFLAPFQSYMIDYADFGQVWRILWIGLLLYQLVVWLRSEMDGEKYAFMLYCGAGMFVASGFWLVALQIIYCLAAWLLYTKKLRAVFDITTMLFVIVAYGCLMLMIRFNGLGFLLLLSYIVFLSMRSLKKYKRMMRRLEEYLFEHGFIVMYVMIPCCMMLLNTVMYFLFKEQFVPYRQYIAYMQSEVLGRYFFMNGNAISYIVSGVRMMGVAWLMMKAQNEGEKQLRSMFVLFVILFVNPLTMGLMAKVSTIEMYGYLFVVLLNPLVDIWLFSALYKAISQFTYGKYVFSTLFVLLAVAENVSFLVNL